MDAMSTVKYDRFQSGPAAPPQPQDETASPPTYHELYPVPSSTAVDIPALEQSQIHQADPRIPERGFLAVSGVRNYWCGTSIWFPVYELYVNEQHIPGEPGPPQSIAEAYRCNCGSCGNTSYVLKESLGVYIKCPFCREISTVKPKKTRRTAHLYLVAGALQLLAALIVLISLIYLIEYTDNTSYRISRKAYSFLVIVLFAFKNLSRAKLYWDISPSTLSDQCVLYHPSGAEWVLIQLMK